MRCTYCGSHKHTERLCPKTASGQQARNALRCSYCGDTSHDIQACPRTHGGSSTRKNYPDTVADHFVLDKRR